MTPIAGDKLGVMRSASVRTLVVWLSIFSLSAAEDPWNRVRDLKSGTELRIYKANDKAPVLAKLDEVKDDSIVVVVKNEQLAIPKDEIERIDHRPPSGSRVTRESKTTSDPPDEARRTPQERPGPSWSSSTSLSVGSKPGFETIYRQTKPTSAK